MATQLPQRNPQLMAWTWIWTLGAFLWTTLSAVIVLSSDTIMRWLLFSGHSRYLMIGGLLVLMLWQPVRSIVNERWARVFLAGAATLFGIFGALLLFALKAATFTTVLAAASCSMGAMVLVGMYIPFDLRKPRRVLEVLRQIAELTLAGVVLGPEHGWIETALVMLGLLAAMVIIGDDSQSLGDDSRVVPRNLMQRVATVRAVDFYLSFFRLFMIFTRLLATPPRRPRT